MAANSHLILLHGPPFSGRDIYTKKYLSSTHERFSPKDMFEKDSNVGLRDVILKVVSLLKQGKKVVVDDENATIPTRQSYLKIVDKKVPAIKRKSLVKIRPKFGCQQIYWYREFCIADQVESDNVKKSPLVDNEISKWYHPKDLGNVNYQKGIVDMPDESEGFSLFEEVLPLVTYSQFKFEIPALFLQWEGIIQKNNDSLCLHEAVISICELWAEANPWGRIIVICDGSSSENPDIVQIKSLLNELIKKFQSSPVYVMQVTDPLESGNYATPPKPGLLAFLQKRHCLDLQSKRTLYLYHHQNHMKMAEAAGVQYMKIGRVLQNPSLILSSHIATKPAVPPFIQQIELQPVDDDSQLPTIPLYRQNSTLGDHYICKNLDFGRCEYLFAKDTDLLDRYQSVYAQNATITGDPVSKIQELIQNKTPSTKNKNVSQRTPLSNKPTVTCSSNTGRDLPKWMVGRSDSPKPSLLSKSDSTSSTEGKTKQTVYIMTEKELVEIATDILKQAGREDIIKEIKLNSPEKTPRKTMNVTNTSGKVNKQEKKINPPGDKTFEPIPGTSKQNVYVPNTLIGQSDDLELSDSTGVVIGDTNSCKCDDLNDISDKTTHLDNDSKSRMTILDDFMNNNLTRKRSPKKKRKCERVLNVDTDTETVISDAEINTANKNQNSDFDHNELQLLKSEGKCDSPKKTVGSRKTEKSCMTLIALESEDESNIIPKSRPKKRENIDSDRDHKPNKKHGPDLSILDEIFN